MTSYVIVSFTVRLSECLSTTREVCGHSYSRSSIQDYFMRVGRDAKCPASGCNKRITMNSLRADKELEKRIKIATRKQQRQQEEDEEDDAEVIE